MQFHANALSLIFENHWVYRFERDIPNLLQDQFH